MVRFLAILFGVGFLAFGVMGFLPGFVNKGILFSLFRINFEHNILHLATGMIGVLCGLANRFASKQFFIIGGAVYVLLAGFAALQGKEMLFEMIAVNTADNIFHAFIGALFLFIGLNLENAVKNDL